MANRNDPFFSRLTSLFRSGPAIQRKVKGYDYKNYYDNQLARGNNGHRGPFPFGRESSPFSVLGSYGILDRMARYSEFAAMEYCLSGDTKIAIPGGYKTLKELADECSNNPDHTFIVYSYDHNEKQIRPAVGRQARMTRRDDAYRVVFDSGKEIIGTADHRLMKRDGTYCEIKDLKSGDAMMPFYRRSMATDRTEGTYNCYQTIYTINRGENPYGWRAEHKLLAEHVLGRKLKPDEVVHHKNFKAHDNRIENLEVMTAIDHQRLHGVILGKRMWDKEKNGEWIEKFKKQHSAWMKEHNPAERKDITFEKILQWCDENEYNLYHVSDAFDTDANTIKRKLASKGFSDFMTFAKAYRPEWKNAGWDNKGEKNPRFNRDVTFQAICSLFSKDGTQKELANKLGVSITPINNRLKENGYKSWSEFASSYENHKVVSVEYYGNLDLYDLTVDGYKNFATDSVISHNTPEIAAALNIFADECSAGDEKGKAFHLYSKNPEVKKALEELFYDILNIDFNIRPWVRNLVKYGDFFLYNEVVPDIGIINVQPIPVNELEREDGFDQNDPYAVRYKWLTRGNRYLENWQVTHMRILGNDLFLPYGTSLLEPARRTWSQLCVRQGTPIWIDGIGYKTIENVKPGDIVQTYDLESNKIIKASVKGCHPMGKQSLVRIKTSHRTIDVTPNHGMLVKTNKGEMIFKEAKDLICSNGKGGQIYRNADKLVLPSGDFETNEKNYTVKMDASLYSKAGRFSHSCNGTVILQDSNNDRTFTTTPDFMRLFGFMHGDGWAKAHNVGFALGVYEEQNEYYIHLFENTFKSLKLRRTNKFNTKSSQVNVTSTELCHLLCEKLGFKTGFANKRIPPWVYSLDQENKIAFLKGLFDADGSDHDGRIGLANKSLIEDTKILAQQSGVVVGEVKINRKAGEGYFNEHNKSIDKKSNFKESYRLYMNFNKINKGSVSFEAVNYVESLPEQDETYDLEVEHPSHNFCANGVISHNTMMEDSMLLYRVVRSPERRVFYIDVGNISPNDVPSYMEAAKETLKSKTQLDKSTGQMDARYNPMDIEADYFIPVRGGQTGTKIETLPGGQNATAVEDVKYLQSKLFAALQVPKAFLNFDENLCMTGKTYVSLLSGKSKTIEELASEFDIAKSNNTNLPENYAYSVTNEGNIMPGKIIDAWKTKEVSETVKVTLDNNEVIESTLSHPFMLRDGSYLRADELKPGASLMPLYRKYSSKKAKQKLEGYEMILNNANQAWIYTHRMARDTLPLETHPSSLLEDVSVVHHKDFDKTNNNPSNLENMGRRYHRQMHIEGSIRNLVCEENRDRLRTLWNAPGSSLRANHKQGVIDAWTDVKQATKRRKAIAETNRACGKIDIMKKKLKEIQMSKVPTYEQLHEYVSKNSNISSNVAKLHYGCSMTQLNHIIKEAGHDDWMCFYKTIYPGSMPRVRNSKSILANKSPNDFVSIAGECKSIEQFCNKINASRIAFKKFLTKHGEDFVTWFTTNLGRHSKSVGKFYNHKVVSVEIVKHENPIPVYDLTIENTDNTHNFALGAGVFVHNSAKASLAQQDVRFSRTISVLQRVILSELNKMAMVHLYSKGFDGEDLIAFELRLSNPSTVAMQQKLEAMSTKFDIAGKAKETLLVDEDWIQRKILELTEDEIIKIESGRRRDKVRSVEIEAVAVAENLPQKNTVTDPFDPSGYVMPGEDVKKNPPVGGSTMVTDIPTNQTSDIQNAAAAGVAIAGNPGAKAKSPTSGVPIIANPFMAKQRHNDRRLVGMGGRDNLQNPNFADMLSATNKHMSDINDKHSLVKLSEETLGKLETTDINLDEYRAPPVITSEMVQLKRKLDAHFEKMGGRKKKAILTENDVNLSKLDDEDDGRLYELTMSGDEIIVEASNKSNNQELSNDLLDELKNL